MSFKKRDSEVRKIQKQKEKRKKDQKEGQKRKYILVYIH